MGGGGGPFARPTVLAFELAEVLEIGCVCFVFVHGFACAALVKNAGHQHACLRCRSPLYATHLRERDLGSSAILTRLLWETAVKPAMHQRCSRKCGFCLDIMSDPLGDLVGVDAFPSDSILRWIVGIEDSRSG